MNKLWQDEAWEDYLYWQSQDRKTLKRINQLLQDISRNGYDGIGKPEPLKGAFTGWWSRRIDDTNRLIYRINNGIIEIAQCRSHYGDKSSNAPRTFNRLGRCYVRDLNRLERRIYPTFGGLKTG